VRGDVDLNSTLATPLARVSDDADGTRPIPEVDTTAHDAVEPDPTVVKRALANHRGPGPGLTPGHQT
jgi:hypothetical protein